MHGIICTILSWDGNKQILYLDFCNITIVHTSDRWGAIIASHNVISVIEFSEMNLEEILFKQLNNVTQMRDELNSVELVRGYG
jgi:hypothetical protein